MAIFALIADSVERFHLLLLFELEHRRVDRHSRTLLLYLDLQLLTGQQQNLKLQMATRWSLRSLGFAPMTG